MAARLTVGQPGTDLGVDITCDYT